MKITKIAMLSLITLAVTSCSTANNLTQKPVTQVEQKPEMTQIEKLKQSGIVPRDAQKVTLAEVSDKEGAAFSVNVNFNDGNFKTKANVAGSAEKKASNIQSLTFYLVKGLTTGYVGTDPIGTEKVAGPFTVDRSGTGPYTLTFSNVPANATNESYYVAVRAFSAVSGGGTELVKVNNGGSTVWTGATLTAGSRVGVSATGVNVSTTLGVSTTTAIPVSINLLDAVGAVLESSVTPTAGTNNLTAGGITGT